MSWHYQIRQRIIKNKKWYDIVEVYDDDNGHKKAHTIEGMKPEGESCKELIHVLEMMLADVHKYKTLVDTEEKT